MLSVRVCAVERSAGAGAVGSGEVDGWLAGWLTMCSFSGLPFMKWFVVAIMAPAPPPAEAV